MKAEPKTLLFLIIGLAATLYIIFSGPLFYVNIPFLMMKSFGLLLIVWALLAKKLTGTHAKEAGKTKPAFPTQGPYEIIRHPIYAGFLLIMMGFVEEEGSFLRFVAMIALIIVVFIQMNREESKLEAKEKDYHAYKARTHKIVPYFY